MKSFTNLLFEHLSEENREICITLGKIKLVSDVGYVKTKEKKQEEYAKVLRCLKQGKSIRDTSVLCGVSVSTVFRVKCEFGV